jgi:hypothetical protein
VFCTRRTRKRPPISGYHACMQGIARGGRMIETCGGRIRSKMGAMDSSSIWRDRGCDHCGRERYWVRDKDRGRGWSLSAWRQGAGRNRVLVKGGARGHQRSWGWERGQLGGSIEWFKGEGRLGFSLLGRRSALPRHGARWLAAVGCERGQGQWDKDRSRAVPTCIVRQVEVSG